MNKEFVPYIESLALKELGFDEPCFGYFDTDDNQVLKFDVVYENKNLPAPLYQQAFRWFREKHQVYAEIFVADDKLFGYLISSFIENGRVDRPMSIGYVFYEEAELYCLRKLIEIVKQTK